MSDQDKINQMMLEQLAALSAKLDALTPKVTVATVPQEPPKGGIWPNHPSGKVKAKVPQAAPLKTGMPSVAKTVPQIKGKPGAPVRVDDLAPLFGIMAKNLKGAEFMKPLLLVECLSSTGKWLLKGVNSVTQKRDGSINVNLLGVRLNDSPNGPKGQMHGGKYVSRYFADVTKGGKSEFESNVRYV